jgi:hypothetical protein
MLKTFLIQGLKLRRNFNIKLLKQHKKGDGMIALKLKYKRDVITDLKKYSPERGGGGISGTAPSTSIRRDFVNPLRPSGS